MRKIIAVHGMKRSGNHGIIHWIGAHGHFDFLNNIVPVRPILQGEKPWPEPRKFNLWLAEQLAIGRSKPLHTGPLSKTDSNAKRPVMFSLEDHELTFRPLIDLPEDTANVLILRDLRNMLASRIKKAPTRDNPAYPRSLGPEMDRVLRLWKEHAREFLGRTRALENRTTILFDAWFTSEAYRRAISRRLGLPFNDKGFSRVSRIGGGSSFDGTKFDGDNRKLDVLNRVRYLSDAERRLLDAATDEEELRELADAVAARGEDLARQTAVELA